MFAGVTKARAIKVTDASSKLSVKVVVAGADSDPLEPTCDLISNLQQALKRYGNPQVQIDVKPHARLIVLISVSISIYPDFVWDIVQANVRTALLYHFGYEALDIGQRVYQSEVNKVISETPGVASIQFVKFTSVGGSAPSIKDLNEAIRVAMATPPVDFINTKTGEVAYMTPDVDQALIINQSTSPRQTR